MLAGIEYDSKNKYHLYFVRAFKITKQDKKRKTPIYIVRKDSQISMAERLGLIKFSGRWRQFVFYPDNETFWSYGCLEIVNKFLFKVNKRWRNKQKLKNVRNKKY